jgi:hypothetical protein
MEKSQILTNLTVIYDKVVIENNSYRWTGIVREQYEHETRERTAKRYKNFILKFEKMDDYFINLITNKTKNELCELRRKLNRYLYFLRRNTAFRSSNYLTIDDLRNDLTEFFEREKCNMDADVDDYKADKYDCKTIYELRRQYKRLNNCNYRLNSLDDATLTFVINKPFSEVSNLYRNLNEYLLILRE